MVSRLGLILLTLLSPCQCRQKGPPAAQKESSSPTPTSTRPASPNVPQIPGDDQAKPPPRRIPEATPPTALPSTEENLLKDWYRRLGPAKSNERFGALITRSARLQLGTPYLDTPQNDRPEKLQLELSSFQCVSFVESVLAISRCTWNGTRDTQCFVQEVQNLRYRQGELRGYDSRLHYFVEWLEDNSQRGHLQPITRSLGGVATDHRFSFMSDHPQRYPALKDQNMLRAIEATETRLSQQPSVVLDRANISPAQKRLQDGDLVAFVGSKKGLLITHAGFVDRSRDGKARVLHASSHHKRVVLTRTDLADYVLRRTERRGVLLSRPLAPSRETPKSQNEASSTKSAP